VDGARSILGAQGTPGFHVHGDIQVSVRAA